MFTRLTNAALCLVLAACPAAGIESQTNEFVKVRVLDANGHSLNDLRPEQFVLRVDYADRQIALWTKMQDLVHHSTYRLVFKADPSVPANRHMIEVQVNLPDARVVILRP